MSDIIPIVLLIIIAYLWSARGFFSSFLHMVCVIIAGAVALGLWEPIAGLLADQAGKNNTWLLSISSALGLLLPFCVTLIVIRKTCDGIIRANLDFDTVTNMIGGGACGAVSGFVTVGILYLSMGFLPPKSDIVGLIDSQAIGFENNGSVVRKSSMLIRADSMTAGFYTMLADSTFFPDSTEPLSKWRPRLADEGQSQGITFQGGARHLYAPDAFEVIGRYSYRPTARDELMADSFQERKQSYTFGDADAGSAASLEGVIVKFKPSSKDKTGQVIVSSPQIWVIARNDSQGKSIMVHPSSVISQAEGSKPSLGRWRFDSQDVFIASVGGASEVNMAFEFPMPGGYKPIALCVKGVRVNIAGKEPANVYASLSERDKAIKSQQILARRLDSLNESQAVLHKYNSTLDEYIHWNDGFPFGMVLLKDNIGGLVIDDGRKIIDGESKFRKQDLENRGIERILQVNKFFQSDDTVVLQVDIDERNKDFGLLSDVVQRVEDKSKPPYLIDTNGQPFAPIGYFFETVTGEVWIKFTPQNPITSLNEEPMSRISRSTPGNKLTLIYRVSKGVRIDRFAIGENVIMKFKPTIDTP